MASDRTRWCSCGRAYVPDRYNAHRQWGCPRCSAKRKRERDRQRYHQRYAEDAGFRTREKARRAAARRRAKARARAAAAVPPPAVVTGPDPAVAELRHTVTGMAALLVGQADSASLGEFMQACAQRGRRLEPVRGLSP